MLQQVSSNESTGIISFGAADDSGTHPTLALRREGDYAVISASYGPLEIALRLRARELIRTLKHMLPNDGLNTTRQVGSGDAFLGLGLHGDGTLTLRPTIVGDGSGYFALNLMLAADAAAALRAWLGDEEPAK